MNTDVTIICVSIVHEEASQLPKEEERRKRKKNDIENKSRASEERTSGAASH